MEYRIIGSDLREYGPVDLEEIRKWIDEGRADARRGGDARGKLSA